MSMITCPECGRRVSDSAEACPGCGYPVAARMEWERARAGRPTSAPPTPPPAPAYPYPPTPAPAWPRQARQRKGQGGCLGTIVTVIILLWLVGTCVSALQRM